MNQHNRFFYISFSLVLLFFVMFAFGCSSGEYTTDEDLSPASSDYYEDNSATHYDEFNQRAQQDSARIISLQEELNRARLENQNLNNQLSELEKSIDSKKSTIVSESILMEYNDALRLFHQRKYGESMAKFQRIYSDHPSIELAPNCIYWVGECYYGMKDYKQAILYFEQVLSEFPESIKDDDALLMIGHSYFRLNNRPKAQEAYNMLQDTHPESQYIKKIPPAFRR